MQMLKTNHQVALIEVAIRRFNGRGDLSQRKHYYGQNNAFEPPHGTCNGTDVPRPAVMLLPARHATPGIRSREAGARNIEQQSDGAA
jgi:hypothetical protein